MITAHHTRNKIVSMLCLQGKEVFDATKRKETKKKSRDY